MKKSSVLQFLQDTDVFPALVSLTCSGTILHFLIIIRPFIVPLTNLQGQGNLFKQHYSHQPLLWCFSYSSLNLPESPTSKRLEGREAGSNSKDPLGTPSLSLPDILKEGI